jgi:hypothetical protein
MNVLWPTTIETRMPNQPLGPECGHKVIEDCLLCAVCGRCRESLDECDVCVLCRPGAGAGASASAPSCSQP